MIPDADYKLILDSIPIPTVDVVILNAERTKTLLFKRSNPPLQDEYYSIGGRVLKNEGLLETACRKAKEELHLEIPASELSFGGVINEIFVDSIYPGVNSHCVNVYYYYQLQPGQAIQLDHQHESHKWFDLDDPTIHPLMREKLPTTSIADEVIRTL